MPALNWIGKALVAAGCLCLAAVGVRFVEADSFQRSANQTLDRELSQQAASPAPVQALTREPVQQPATIGGLIGRLEIPRLHLSVIVTDGDDDSTLAKAVGHVPGTAFPWESGNAVMAGHRDTFFLPLQNVREGDTIRLTTTRGTFDYQVIHTAIVDPDDVSVLAPTPFRSLTLVTCYPFAYVGRAPKRFIITAW